MTSMPASRNARAMILAPRSCPSRPGLATTTRILRPDWLCTDASTRVSGRHRTVPAAAGAVHGLQLSAAEPRAAGLTAARERPVCEQRGDDDDHRDHREQAQQGDDVEPHPPTGV